MKVFNVSWKDYLTKTNTLFRKLEKFHFDYIYSIPRGGLIAGVILSHKLNIPLVDIYNYKLEKNKILLVFDDISDLGKTLYNISFFIKSFIKCSAVYATLFIKEKTSFVPNFYIKQVHQNWWVKFPYEVLKNDKRYKEE